MIAEPPDFWTLPGVGRDDVYSASHDWRTRSELLRRYCQAIQRRAGMNFGNIDRVRVGYPKSERARL